MKKLLSFLYYVLSYITKGKRRAQLIRSSIDNMPRNSPGLLRAHLALDKLSTEEMGLATVHTLRRLSMVRDAFRAQEGREPFVDFVMENWTHSHAQLFQDLWVLHETGEQPGYFVEFGATDGVLRSNTRLLEKKGWTGILAEPNSAWHTALKANRSVHICTDCVWSATGETLHFDVTDDPELAGVTGSFNSDQHNRVIEGRLEVKTISLADLLDRYDAPEVIDFMSVDTEGSELDILQAYPFATGRRFKRICIEHNFVEEKIQALDKLLVPHGYRRVLPDLSSFDCWYVHQDA